MTIETNALRENLCAAFCNNVEVGVIDSETVSISLPLSGRDGDQVVAYATQMTGGWRVSDMGSTLMRLSYENDLSKLLTGARQKLFSSVLAESGLQEHDGEIFTEVPADALTGGLFTLGQGVIRLEDLGLWTQNRVESTFYDDLRAIIADIVPDADLVENYIVPNIEGAENYPVDFYIKTQRNPLYLFGVLNKDKAMLSTIIIQHLRASGAKFDAMVVYQDIDAVPRPHTKRLMSAANDTVASIGERDAIKEKIEHRRAA